VAYKEQNTGFRRQKNNNYKNNKIQIQNNKISVSVHRFAVTSFIKKREISPAAHAAGFFIA
jgi:hypothetical protein